MSTDNRRRRLLHLVPNLEVGGAESLVYEWVSKLDPDRYNSSVLCLGHLGPLGERLIEEGHRAEALNAQHGFRWSTVRELVKYVRRNRIEILHAHTYTPFFYATFARMTRACDRLVYTEHGRLYPEPHRPKRRAINPLLCLAADRIVSISDATRQAMDRYDGIPQRRIEVIWNGVELESRSHPPTNSAAAKRALGLEPTALVFGMAARLVTLKDIPTAIDAFAAVSGEFPEARLVIAGDGPERANLESKVAELGLDPYVRFLGMRDDLDHVYAAFDVFVLSSLTEGISVTLLETMSRGIPSIVTGVGGNPEVVVDGTTGWVVDGGDVEQMAKSMKSLLEDADRRRTMGLAAAERARSEFSLETMFERYEDVYRKR